ncbi:MAG: hypothetical protein P1V36_00395 [Planctomycetota bacterium]|nr:hypothetical protein [Planctomycetota bacterium]
MISEHDTYYEVVRAGPHEGKVASLYELRAIVEEESDGSLHFWRSSLEALYDDDEERFAVLAQPGWHNDGHTLLNSHGRVIAWIDSSRSARVRLAGPYYDVSTIVQIPYELARGDYEAALGKLRSLVSEFVAAFDRCYPS